MKTRVMLTALFLMICMLGVPEGRCPKCGLRRFGWALRNPRHQTCPKCGTGLEITGAGRKVSKGYSPFDAEKHLLKPSEDVHLRDEEKNGQKKK